MPTALYAPICHPAADVFRQRNLQCNEADIHLFLDILRDLSDYPLFGYALDSVKPHRRDFSKYGNWGNFFACFEELIKDRAIQSSSVFDPPIAMLVDIAEAVAFGRPLPVKDFELAARIAAKAQRYD